LLLESHFERAGLALNFGSRPVMVRILLFLCANLALLMLLGIGFNAPG
jgi:hypothetical protein